jgi:hypothetical protein|tara:strand:+ start:2451 stop:3323 length:873 start_codon:yes stop_codon:yes gene_type:complete
MRPEVFEASIKNNTDRLYVIGNRKVVCKNGAFIHIGGNQVHYQLENTESLNIKRKFTVSGQSIQTKNDFTYRISPSDILNITFNEYEACDFKNVKDNNKFKYKIGDLIYSQGGVASSSKDNLTGENTEFNVTKVDAKGNILEISISSPGKYVTPPQNPVKLLHDSGEFITADVEYEEAESSSILERDIKSIVYNEGKTSIEFHYPLPQDVKEGEFAITKQVIILNKKYSLPSAELIPCEMTFDFSPVAKIPLLSNNSSNPYAMYNEGIKMIEKKFIEMEKRISNLENRNI